MLRKLTKMDLEGLLTGSLHFVNPKECKLEKPVGSHVQGKEGEMLKISKWPSVLTLKRVSTVTQVWVVCREGNWLLETAKLAMLMSQRIEKWKSCVDTRVDAQDKGAVRGRGTGCTGTGCITASKVG